MGWKWVAILKDTEMEVAGEMSWGHMLMCSIMMSGVVQMCFIPKLQDGHPCDRKGFGMQAYLDVLLNEDDEKRLYPCLQIGIRKHSSQLEVVHGVIIFKIEAQ